MLCHVNLAREYRGGERQTELLLRELAQRGWQQRLLVRSGQELARRCEDVPSLDTRVVANAVQAGFAAGGCELLHCHDAKAVYSGYLARLRFGIPFLLTRRVLRRQKSSWLRDRAYAAAAAVVGVSEAVRAHIAESYPQVRSDVVADAHADLPVDAQMSEAIRARYPGKQLIGHIGSYDHSAKGQLTLIEAAERAATERPDWQFLLLGAGHDEQRFRQRIGSLQNIELVGFVENVGDYLAAFDVFTFPSLHEALGSSVLDAMHFGLPIVATRVGGIPEFVRDGVNGYLIDRESPDQLFARVADVIDNPEQAGQMHLANRAVADAFSASAMADAYEAIYRRIAAPKRG